MKQYNLTSKSIQLLIVFLLVINLQGFSVTKTWDGSSSNNWNTAANWTPSGVPASGDDVTVPNNFTVTINTAAVCNSFTYGSGTANQTITISAGNSLTVTNAFTFAGVTRSGRTKTFAIGAESLTCGSISMPNCTNGGIAQITISTGSITVNGDISMLGSVATENKIVFSGSGNLNIDGSWTATTFTFTPSTSLVSYTKSGDQTILGTTYTKLKIAGSGDKSLGDNVTVTGTLNLDAGKLAIAGFTLTTNDTVKRNSGTITGSTTSNLTVGGTVDSVKLFMTQTSSATRTLNNLTVTRPNGVFISDTLELDNTLDISNAAKVNGNGKLILISTSNATARVVDLTNGSVTGDVITQRFVPGGSGKRRWRFLTSPVNVSGSIPYSQLIDDIYITGTGGPTNGWDNASGSPSARTYDETMTGSSSTGWSNPSSTSVTVPKGMGISTFVRGSRTLIDPFLTTTVPDDVTIDFVGKLNQGEVDISSNITYTNTGAATADGFCLVANPYMSNIDWESTNITKTNIGSVIYVLNPTTGSYATYDVATSTGVNGGTRYISSSQGFFIRTNAASPVLKFQETAKVTNTAGEFFRSAVNPNLSASAAFGKIRLTAIRDAESSDELVIVLGDTAKRTGNDGSDAAKFFNDNTLNFYTRSTELRNLAINYFPKPTANDTIRVSFFSTVNNIKFLGTYKIEVSELTGLPTNLLVYLWDTYANQLVDLKETMEYVFDLTTDVASAGNDRFKILFKQDTTTVTKITSFSANLVSKNVTINWSSNKEIKTNYYFVEHSKNLVKYSKLKPTKVLAYNNGDGFNAYSLIDNNPSKGKNYYRLSMVDSLGNTMVYSEILEINYVPSKGNELEKIVNNLENSSLENIEIVAYPNPATDFVNLQLKGLDSEIEYQISIKDIVGKEISRSKFMSSSNTSSLDISSLSSGIYFLSVISKNNVTLASSKLIKK